MLWSIVSFLILGLVAGFVARAVVPGKDAMSIPMTIALGIVGSFVGGFLFRALNVIFTGAKWSGSNGSNLTAGIFGSIVGAIIALLAYRMYFKKSDTGGLAGTGRR